MPVQDDAGVGDLSPGWATDLAVLGHSGSLLECRGDHLLVRTPDNPAYHWGNFVLALDPATLHDADHWLAAFRTAFPSATWVAIGLARMPHDVSAWTRLGLPVEIDDVLTTSALPLQVPLADGYGARRLESHDDWEQHVALAVRENARTGEHEPAGYERFERVRTPSRRSLSDRDVAAWFGAFRGDVLVADLGIVLCGTTARYQSVGTDAEHRRRGLAGHLLGVAARWAADHGANRWVILTEATNPAGRLYRRVGFAPDVGNAQAYRPPPR